MSDDKPREWWISDEDEERVFSNPSKEDFEHWEKWNFKPIHVIEKSAYNSLVESLILAKKQRDQFEVELRELQKTKLGADLSEADEYFGESLYDIYPEEVSP